MTDFPQQPPSNPGNGEQGASNLPPAGGYPQSPGGGYPPNVPPAPGQGYPQNVPPTPGQGYPQNVPPTPGQGYPPNVPPAPGQGYPQNVPPAPGQGYQMGQYQQAPPTAKSSKTVIFIVLGVIGAILLGIGGCSYAIFRAVSGPIDTANEFMAANVEGDRAAATEYLATASGCDGEGIVDGLETLGLSTYNFNGSLIENSIATVTGTLTFDSDPTLGRYAEVNLLNQDGDWKVCTLIIDQ